MAFRRLCLVSSDTNISKHKDFKLLSRLTLWLASAVEYWNFEDPCEHDFNLLFLLDETTCLI